MCKKTRSISIALLFIIILCFLTSCAKAGLNLSIALPAAVYQDDEALAAQTDDAIDNDTAFDPQVLSLFQWNGLSYPIPIEAKQIILVVSEGYKANLFVFNKESYGWSFVMGPRFCVIGAKGLTTEKSESGEETPCGLYTLGSVCSSTQTAYYKRQLNRLDIDYNNDSYTAQDVGISIYGAEQLSAGTEDGSIAIGYSDLGALLTNIDETMSPLLLVLPAEQANWKLEAGMPSNFVYATEEIPGILEEARYATSHNFTGASITGYYGIRVVVSRQVAQGLKSAMAVLKEQGLGLLLYDGYRPERATNSMIAWITQPEDNKTKQEFYPDITKAQIASKVFVAAPSSHSRGAAVDLTLVDLKTGQPVDMGGSFDFFDSTSSYYSNAVTQAQLSNRRLLRQVMIDAGFTPYDVEWWHFNITDDSGLEQYQDFVIAR